MLGCPRKLGSMVRINGLFHLLINGVYWGYNPLTNHLLTSWDIQVGFTAFFFTFGYLGDVFLRTFWKKHQLESQIQAVATVDLFSHSGLLFDSLVFHDPTGKTPSFSSDEHHAAVFRTRST